MAINVHNSQSCMTRTLITPSNFPIYIRHQKVLNRDLVRKHSDEVVIGCLKNFHHMFVLSF